MDKKQISQIAVIILAIFFIGASVASARLKTLRKIRAGSITNPYIGDGAVNSAKIEDRAVTSAEIALDTIINANVASNAAISGTKISPNFGSQQVATTGNGSFGSLTVDDTITGTGGANASVYVDADLMANNLQISPSNASADSATIATPPGETCNAGNHGGYEFVDDTNAAGVWLWICEQTGTGTYAWGRIQ
jgi:hypothetical protein